MTEEELLEVIEAAAKDGRTELDLSGEGLQSLPAEIGQLTSLQSLDLGVNQLSSLPAEIGQLTSLQTLHLGDNQLSSLPAEIVQLTGLQTLYLWENQLSSLPAEIVQLTSLTKLDLSNNQLSSLPREIVQLTSLQTLDLSNNQLSSLPREIVQLTSLQTLDLSDNQLSSLPREIVQLTSLQSLNLSFNQLSSLPVEIVQLTSLQSLNLNENQLSSLPVEIVQLTSLQSLNLNENQLSSLPAEIGQLTSLQSLDLIDNQLSSLPAEIGQLTSLQTLDLNENQLSSLPAEIGQLTSLQSLYLIDNQLSSLPAEIGQLTSLQSLYLSNNQLSSLPAEIGQLTSLQSLNLWDNQLSSLPAEIRQLTSLTKLDLGRNPLPIPSEILNSKGFWKDPGDVNEILDFYFRVQDPNETEPLYEAKFLIVGEGDAGKTSLAKKISDDAYELQPREPSTEGIDVIRWDFTLSNGHPFRVNIWDFGGQEIYHQTHQFFLTERSLYALIADTRKENTDFYYWLKVIELLSDHSPVLIIKNEKDDRPCQVNAGQLRGEFDNLKEVLTTNLASDRGLPQIKDAIQTYISRLPHVGTPLPKLWVRVRTALENNTQNTLSFDEYCQLCRHNSLTDKTDMLRLSRYLHDLGICLHFQKDPVLKHTIILKPAWATRAVYQVLDTDTVVQNFGRFSQSDLTAIWQNTEYADLQDELLHLMMRFKLCYEIPTRPGHYIAPHLLSIAQPTYDWDDTHNLLLRYEYDFMPKGILTRFIVELHHLIEDQIQVWKNGVILNNNRARAEIIEHYRDRKGEIKIRVSGSDKKALLTIVNHELQKIHDSYERLQYDKFIPCNCDRCHNQPSPYEYPFKELQYYLDQRRYEIECRRSFEKVNVRGLIDDIIPGSLREPYEKIRKMPSNPIRDQIFISYSHQDETWLSNLKTHLKPMIRNQTVNAWDDKNIKPGANWRDEIETALAKAKVAVLLVSPNFLASDFIAEKELPPLLEAAEAQGPTIIWIPVSTSSYDETEIEQYQSAHPPNQPLDTLTIAQQNQAWVNICKKIKAAANP
jgi:Leucine-rich repeat (LRR) protein